MVWRLEKLGVRGQAGRLEAGEAVVESGGGWLELARLCHDDDGGGQKM